MQNRIKDPDDFTDLKVALVHDWLNGMRGGEKCLEQICQWFPNAPVYTLLYDKEKLSEILQNREVITSKIQRFPFWKKHYRYYLPFFPGAIEAFDFSGYDLILSTSHCVAKSPVIGNRTFHICYCFTPMRYAWGFYQEYFKQDRLHKAKSVFLKRILRRLREWDRKTAERVNCFIAISENVRKRIKMFYKRDAYVIYPPCDTDYFDFNENVIKSDYYLIVSALVPYKRIDLAIEAFNNSGKQLKIIGGGTDLGILRNIAGNNIEFLGWQSDETLKKYYQKAKAVIFPGKEDLGIVPIEAQSCGTPVIAYGEGGVLETVVDGKTGVFFNDQEPGSLTEALHRFEDIEFDPMVLRENALKFSKEVFEKSMKSFIMKRYNEFIDKNNNELDGE